MKHLQTFCQVLDFRISAAIGRQFEGRNATIQRKRNDDYIFGLNIDYLVYKS